MIPGFWMNETTVLQPAVLAYLEGRSLTESDVAAIRAYLRQWINAPAWRGPAIDGLRDAVDSLTNRANIDRWLERAVDAGIDPF